MVVAYNHSGDAANVERDLAPLRSGPEPISSTNGSQPYLEVQVANDLEMGPGHRSYIMGAYADDVRPEALDRLVEHVARGPEGGSFSITVQGGGGRNASRGTAAKALPIRESSTSAARRISAA